MTGRKYAAPNTNYRYGFNGKENDNEVKGEGSQQDYGMRIYDPRIGKFLSIDPLAKKYPWYTPFQFAGNMPISAIDLDGAEPYSKTMPFIYKHSQPHLKKFAEGVANVILGAFGAITQVFGAAEYGDRIPKDRFAEQFPSLANNNIAKDLILPIISSPLDLAKKLKEDPTNEELWGEATGLMLLYRGGILESKFKSKKLGGLKVDLMGGEKSRYGTQYINYDIKATSGIKGKVEEFQNHFGENTVGQIVANNPVVEFLESVTSSLEKGGTITIRGQMSNKVFSSIWEGRAKGLEAYEVVEGSKKTGLSTEGYSRSDGTPLRGSSNSVNEIVLRKK